MENIRNFFKVILVFAAVNEGKVFEIKIRLDLKNKH